MALPKEVVNHNCYLKQSNPVCFCHDENAILRDLMGCLDLWPKGNFPKTKTQSCQTGLCPEDLQMIPVWSGVCLRLQVTVCFGRPSRCSRMTLCQDHALQESHTACLLARKIPPQNCEDEAKCLALSTGPTDLRWIAEGKWLNPVIKPNTDSVRSKYLPSPSSLPFGVKGQGKPHRLLSRWTLRPNWNEQCGQGVGPKKAGKWMP